jgi:integrase
VSDVDFMRGIVHPEVQYPADPLKTEMRSMAAIPIPNSLAMTLSAHIARFSSTWIMCDESAQQMGPWQMQREVRARAKVKVYPMGSGSTNLRHFYASLLISSRLDVKVVQSRLRHASAKTTLDTYHTFGRIPMTALGPQSTMRSRPGAILRTFAD